MTKAEIYDAVSEVARREGTLDHIPDRLTDLSGIEDIEERESDFETILSVAKERRQQIFPNKFRSAIVAPTPLAYGFARMFQTLNSNPQIDIQIFGTKALAESWLAITEPD